MKVGKQYPASEPVFRPKKSWGQNFLRDKALAEQIVDIARLPINARVLELGSGQGILTKALAKRVIRGRVLACEKDRLLTTRLRSIEKKFSNLEVRIIDALWLLKRKDHEIFQTPYYIVANIPFGITNPVIRFINQEITGKLKRASLLMQKEVAEKLTAKVGSSKRTIQTVFLQSVARAEIIRRVGRENFYPSPKVDSAIISISPFPLKSSLPVFFERVVKALFAQKRKTILNNLSANFRCSRATASVILKKAKLKGGQRAQELTVSQLARLARVVNQEFAKGWENNSKTR